jgi:predicted Rossmann fold flavoprotein
VAACDVLVIGGGAAGLMCAIEAGRRGRSVCVLDHAREIGRKILISGGGRCNFTNLYTHPDNFLSENPHFAKSALARYTPSDFIAVLDRHGIPYHEKKAGQMFCDRSARDVVELLLAECRAASVRVVTGCHVEEIRRELQFRVATNHGAFSAASLVIATGGLSIPKIGATGFGYRAAKQFGLRIVPCRPALVPLVLAPEARARYCGLAGVSTEVIASFGEARFREKMLVTHRGLSGPAILQISSYWDGARPVEIDLLPGMDLERPAERVELKTLLAARLPRRFAERWLDHHGGSRPAHTLSASELASINRGLHSWTISPAGTEGYEKAEVTAGGVSTAGLSSKTMEANKAPGLYFIGEVVDVTGHLGGFNFQWAWASGWCAGQHV